MPIASIAEAGISGAPAPDHPLKSHANLPKRARGGATSGGRHAAIDGPAVTAAWAMVAKAGAPPGLKRRKASAPPA